MTVPRTWRTGGKRHEAAPGGSVKRQKRPQELPGGPEAPEQLHDSAPREDTGRALLSSVRSLDLSQGWKQTRRPLTTT